MELIKGRRFLDIYFCFVFFISFSPNGTFYLIFFLLGNGRHSTFNYVLNISLTEKFYDFLGPLWKKVIFFGNRIIVLPEPAFYPGLFFNSITLWVILLELFPKRFFIMFFNDMCSVPILMYCT